MSKRRQVATNQFVRRNIIPWTADDVRQMTAGYGELHSAELVELQAYIDTRGHGDPQALIDILTLTDKAPDWTTISRLFQGNYPQLGHFMATNVAAALKKVRADIAGYVALDVCREITDCLDMWSDINTMAEIVAPTGRSKTFSAYEWHLGNPYSVYVYVPPFGGGGAFLREMATKMGLSDAGTLETLSRDISSHLGRGNTIIIDQADWLRPQTPHSPGIKILNFLMRLHDEQKVTIVFIATDVFEEAFSDGGLTKYMAQHKGRTKFCLRVPGVTPEEVATIVLAFCPDPRQDLLDAAFEAATTPAGTRPLFDYLKIAKILVGDDNMTVSHFRKAGRYAREMAK